VAKLINTLPVASDQVLSTLEETAKTITLSAADDDGDPLTFTVLTLRRTGRSAAPRQI